MLFIGGFLTGLIDAIAGGGGLISLPLLAIVLGNGPHSIGTNKIVGTVAALSALWVYARHSKIPWKIAIEFSLAISLGSLGGSAVSPHLPQVVFRYLILLSFPIVLYLVWNRRIFVSERTSVSKMTPVIHLRAILLGLGVGFYDGAWGPGGGTLMFLSLLSGVHLPLIVALAASKFANTLSAGVSLVNYARQGFVHWQEGAIVGLGAVLGATIGAKVANRQMERVVRPALLFICIAVLLKTLGVL